MKEKNNVKHFHKEKLHFQKKVNSQSIPDLLKFFQKVELYRNSANSQKRVKDVERIQVIILVNQKALKMYLIENNITLLLIHFYIGKTEYINQYEYISYYFPHTLIHKKCTLKMHFTLLYLIKKFF